MMFLPCAELSRGGDREGRGARKRGGEDRGGEEEGRGDGRWEMRKRGPEIGRKRRDRRGEMGRKRGVGRGNWDEEGKGDGEEEERVEARSRIGSEG